MQENTRRPRPMSSTAVTVVTTHRDGRVDRRQAYIVHESGHTVPAGDRRSPCLRECCEPGEATA